MFFRESRRNAENRNDKLDIIFKSGLQDNVFSLTPSLVNFIVMILKEST